MVWVSFPPDELSLGWGLESLVQIEQSRYMSCREQILQEEEVVVEQNVWVSVDIGRDV